jgi:hypothetical protein
MSILIGTRGQSVGRLTGEDAKFEALRRSPGENVARGVVICYPIQQSARNIPTDFVVFFERDSRWYINPALGMGIETIASTIAVLTHTGTRPGLCKKSAGLLEDRKDLRLR